jgi:hypothetical protein
MDHGTSASSPALANNSALIASPTNDTTAASPTCSKRGRLRLRMATPLRGLEVPENPVSRPETAIIGTAAARRVRSSRSLPVSSTTSVRMVAPTIARYTACSGAEMRSRPPIRDPTAVTATNGHPWRSGIVRRYAMILNTLFQARSRAARAIPSRGPRMAARAGTRIRLPP